MPDGVINAVHRLARRQKQGFRFTYNDNTPIEATEEDNSDSESDTDYVPSDESSSDEEDDDDDAPQDPLITGVDGQHNNDRTEPTVNTRGASDNDENEDSAAGSGHHRK